MFSLKVVVLLACVSSISAINVKLSFNGKGYAKCGHSLPELQEFTLCYWIKNHKEDVDPTYVFSYATATESNMLVTWQTHVNDSTTFGINIGGDSVQMKLSVVNSNLNAHPFGKWQLWHHVCYGWSSHTMTGYIAIDGCSVDAKTIVKINNPETTVVRRGGIVVLGQHQDVYNGEFDSKKAFSGDLFGLHLWDEMLHVTKIKGIEKCRWKSGPGGNVISWLPKPLEMQGVSIQGTEVCDLLKNQFESTSCRRY